MVQVYYDDIFSESNDADDDLTKIEKNFISLRSCFSGTVFLGTAGDYSIEPFMEWGDTYNHVPRMVNPDYGGAGGEEEFLGLMFGDEAQMVWVYRDSAMDGWVVSGKFYFKDNICAIRSDSGPYSVSPGGTWEIGIDAHLHQWFKVGTAASGEKTYDEDGSEINIPTESTNPGAPPDDWCIGVTPVGKTPFVAYLGGTTVPAQFSNSSYTSLDEVSETSAWRPAAAVGTLQYIKHVEYV